MICAGAITGVLRTPATVSVAFLGALFIASLARLPLRWYLSRIAVLFFALGLFLIVLPLADHGDESRWHIGLISISPLGIRVVVILLLKAMALLSLVLAAAASAPVNVHLKALHALRVPSLIIQLASLTFRYLSVLEEEFTRIRIALRVRGYRSRSAITSLRIAGHVGGMLLLRASERAERVSHALRCRGFDGKFRALTAFHTRPLDVFFFVTLASVSIGLLAWDWFQR